MIQCLNVHRVSRPPRGGDCSTMRWYATSSYMRKWMSERLKRRKKPGDGSSKEATKAPEPLQPRFYDNEPAAAAEVPVPTPVEEPVVESRRPSRPQPEPTAASGPAAEPGAGSAVVEPKPRTSRRRRSRGGRGRSRQGRVAAAPAVAAEPSVGESAAAEVSALEPVVAGKFPVAAAP